MATFTKTSSDTNTKRLVAAKIFKKAIIDSYFSKFMGEGENNIVQVNKDFAKNKGSSSVVFTIFNKLVGAGVTGSTRLKGQEEKLTEYNFSITPQLYRHATAVENGLTEQFDSFNVPTIAQDRLKDWMTEKIDTLCFNALFTSPTNTAFGGDATTVNTLDSSDKITPTHLRKLNVYAKTGKNRTYNPLIPIPVNGRKYLVYLASPESIYDLKEDSTMAQYLREAEVRGKENPIFNGATLIFDNIVIHEHERITTATNSGSVKYSRNILLGAQALVWAWAKRPWVVEEMDDYEHITGWAINMVSGAGKPSFNSVDYGSIVDYVAISDIL